MDCPLLTRLDISTCRLNDQALLLLHSHSLGNTLEWLDISYNQNIECIDFPAQFC